MMMSRTFRLNKSKKDLFSIYEGAVKAVGPERLMKNALVIEKDKLIVKDYFSKNNQNNVVINRTNSNIHVIGGGKSVLAMASGLVDVAIASNQDVSLFSHGCLSVPEGLRADYNSSLKAKLESIKTSVCFGSSNNLPDEQSVEASQSILNCIDEACEFDRAQNREPLFIVLVSGGGSACLACPKLISLEAKLKLTQFLVQRGASIVELNKVRRYFSKIKGGQLAAYILKSQPESKIITLILSDVIGDPIKYIASGPTFLETSRESSRDSMIRVLRKYDYPELTELMENCNKLDDNVGSITNAQEHRNSVINRIIGNNSIVLHEAKLIAESLGYRVLNLGNDLQGYSDKIVERFVKVGLKSTSAGLNDGKLLVIGGGETTIKKLVDESWGEGGRVQEMCLDYLISKNGSNSPDNIIDLFLAGTTDGQDGPTDVAACMVSFSEWVRRKPFNLDDVIKAKTSHDSYNFWSVHKPDCLIKTGLTGTNVMDFYMHALVFG